MCGAVAENDKVLVPGEVVDCYECLNVAVSAVGASSLRTGTWFRGELDV